MSEKGGYITISRKLFEHALFKEPREFSKFEAWLDLIQECAFEEKNTMVHRGRIIEWGRGQTIASVRYLQQRWKWKSIDRVSSFLELLRSQGMIKTDNDQGIGRITLCKYDDYNRKTNADRTRTSTQSRHRPDEIKEYKEIKEEERRARETAFYETLIPFLEKYGKDMLRAFFNYWSEWNQSQTKMRFELKETWQIEKRLSTWAKRDDQFTKEPEKEPIKIKLK